MKTNRVEIFLSSGEDVAALHLPDSELARFSKWFNTGKESTIILAAVNIENQSRIAFQVARQHLVAIASGADDL